MSVMDALTLFLILVVLLFLLMGLVVVYVWINRSKPLASPEGRALNFGELKALIHDKHSDNRTLNSVVNEIIERFIVIDGTERTIEDFTGMIEVLCVHAHTDSKMILKLDKALRNANPRYKERIEKSIKTALAERDKRSR